MVVTAFMCVIPKSTLSLRRRGVSTLRPDDTALQRWLHTGKIFNSTTASQPVRLCVVRWYWALFYCKSIFNPGSQLPLYFLPLHSSLFSSCPALYWALWICHVDSSDFAVCHQGCVVCSSYKDSCSQSTCTALRVLASCFLILLLGAVS